MNIIIIGNGVAGQTCAEKLLSLQKEQNTSHEITIITEEKYSYYSRINLPKYLTDEITKEKLILRKPEWFTERGINLILGTKITSINKENKKIIDDKGKNYDYDKLILALGSSARRLPFTAKKEEGLFTLRTLADIEEIKSYVNDKKVKDIFVFGGGLLSLEIAYHLNEGDYNLTVGEVFPYLLPRQLDKGTSSLLEIHLKNKGMNFICGISIIDIKPKGNKLIVTMKDKDPIESELIIEQVGITPNVELAKQAELHVHRGIIVNEYMQTSDENIYACGDCIEYKNEIWGIIPASREQAIACAYAIFGNSDVPYCSTSWSTTLKISGIKVRSYGTIPPPEQFRKEDYTPPEEIIYINMDENICRKAYIKDGKLIGAVFLGEGDDKFFRTNLDEKIDIEEAKKLINK